MNRIIKAICQSYGRYDAVSPLYQKLQILKIPQLYSMELLKFMFSYEHNLLPANFNSYFEKVKTMHTHGTRMASQSKFLIPRYNTVTGQKSLMYSGAVMWNSLPRHITECDTVTSYCKRLKKYLLDSSEQ